MKTINKNYRNTVINWEELACSLIENLVESRGEIDAIVSLLRVHGLTAAQLEYLSFPLDKINGAVIQVLEEGGE